MSIRKRSLSLVENPALFDKVVERLGLSEGQSNTEPKDGRRWFILCRNMDFYVECVRQMEKNLQQCKSIVNSKDCLGIGFSSPLVELVVVEGWEEGEVGEDGFRLISRYCLERRVNDAPRWNLNAGRLVV